METKICNKCGIEKELIFFYKRLNGHRNDCIECNKKRKREYYNNNLEKFITQNRENHIKNRESRLKKQKTYREENKQKISNYNRSYIKMKMKTDVIFKLKKNLNVLIRNSLIGYTKKARTYEILGCSYIEFKLHLESKFESWMTWENRGLYNGELNHGWDIDHIMPVSSGKTEEEIIKLNHYTNLQPLCSKINRDIKKDKILEQR